MIRKIMKLGDYRAGIVRWDLEQTPELMEMGFGDVVQPVYVMERDIVYVTRFQPLPNVAIGAVVSLLVVPEGQVWVINSMSLYRLWGDRLVHRVGMVRPPHADMLVLPGIDVVHWVGGADMGLIMPSGSALSAEFVGGVAATSNHFTFGVVHHRLF